MKPRDCSDFKSFLFIENLQIFALTITLVYVSSSICSYQNSGNSPIQLISIRPSARARMLPIHRDGRYNKNINRNFQRERDGRASPIIKIIQIQNAKPTKYQRQFQFGLDNGHSVPLHIASGAYPVYYVIARANGHFKGDNIRSFKSKQF